MEYRVIEPRFGAGDDDFETFFLQAEVGIEGIHRFGGIAEGHEDFHGSHRLR